MGYAEKYHKAEEWQKYLLPFQIARVGGSEGIQLPRSGLEFHLRPVRSLKKTHFLLVLCVAKGIKKKNIILCKHVTKEADLNPGTRQAFPGKS